MQRWFFFLPNSCRKDRLDENEGANNHVLAFLMMLENKYLRKFYTVNIGHCQTNFNLATTNVVLKKFYV
jgi:hypothetical protein